MNVTGFGRATIVTILLTAFCFLAVYASGVPATPRMMAPWSAFAFSIIGLTLWIAPHPRTEKLALHYLGAILVFSIGAILCAEHMTQASSTAFDRFLFPNLLSRNTALPGRPAPLAGFR